MRREDLYESSCVFFGLIDIYIVYSIPEMTNSVLQALLYANPLSLIKFAVVSVLGLIGCF